MDAVMMLLTSKVADEIDKPKMTQIKIIKSGMIIILQR
jgi:hypothetical protein